MHSPVGKLVPERHPIPLDENLNTGRRSNFICSRSGGKHTESYTSYLACRVHLSTAVTYMAPSHTKYLNQLLQLFQLNTIYMHVLNLLF